MSRRFPPPWTVDRPHSDSFVVKDANGIVVATVHCRDDLQKWSFGHSKLTSDEARKIARAISRIPQFMMQRRGLYSRGQGNYRWKPARRYHVALEDGYIRKHYDGISTLCKLNGIPFDAMMFWDRFKGRWLTGEEFSYPARPTEMPAMKELVQAKGFWSGKPPDLRR
jgi:hypothetical protein